MDRNDGGTFEMTDRENRMMMTREARRSAPRIGGVSSTERTSPGCVIARFAIAGSLRRNYSEVVHRQP